MRQRLERSQHGQAVLGVVVGVVVLATVGAAVVMLQRTLTLGRHINAKAASIAKTGRGINTSTDAIIQLNRTNDLGRSILASARPLQPKLAEVVRLAQSIDGRAGSINDSANAINASAHAINSTGGSINNTAKGINGQAGAILATAQSIESGVAQINRNVDATISLAQQIRADLGNILVQANTASKESACIDEQTGGPSDGHCR